MIRAQKDLTARLLEVDTAWQNMRPGKVFFGLTLEEFRQKAKPFIEARDEIAALDSRTAHAVSNRDAASGPLLALIQGIVDAVKGDPAEGPDGALYAAMGYVRKSERATGLVRRGKVDPPAEGLGG